MSDTIRGATWSCPGGPSTLAVCGKVAGGHGHMELARTHGRMPDDSWTASRKRNFWSLSLSVSKCLLCWDLCPGAYRPLKTTLSVRCQPLKPYNANFKRFVQTKRTSSRLCLMMHDIWLQQLVCRQKRWTVFHVVRLRGLSTGQMQDMLTRTALYVL